MNLKDKGILFLALNHEKPEDLPFSDICREHDLKGKIFHIWKFDLSMTNKGTFSIQGRYESIEIV